MQKTMKKEVVGFVYLTTNNINGKKYIGRHHGTVDDNYRGTGSVITKAINKHGRENFSREILEFENDIDKLVALEEKYIAEHNAVEDPNYYNVTPSGLACILYGEDNGFFGKTHSEETRAIISAANKGKIISEEHRASISEHSKGQWSDPDFRERVLESRKVTLEKHREAGTGRFSAETKAKQSAAAKGRKVSEEQKAKLSKKALERWSDPDKRAKFMDAHKKRVFKPWSEERKEASRQRLIAYNQSPEKLKKQSERQTGSKHSEERKSNLSKGLLASHASGKISVHTKGKVCYTDIITNKLVYLKPDETPSPNLVKGGKKKKNANIRT